MRQIPWLLAFVSINLLASSVPAQEKKVEVTFVKYEGLKQEILKHRGKVVVVDFWATNCPPCIAALPHYVELQKKLADKGLVVMTVSVDPPDNAKKIARANAILTEVKSPLRNLLLDEPPQTWHSKLEFDSLPFVYIFDRRGKWVRYRGIEFKSPEEYEAEVNKTVTQMLSEK